jgi:hypothetical protein
MEKRITVLVDASFEKDDKLFAWLKRYGQHSDDDFIYWNEFAFTTARLPEYDAVLILNHPSKKIQTSCYPEKLIAFMMEPGDIALHPWMYKNMDQYSRVFSPITNAANTVLSHGYLGWQLQEDHQLLSSLALPQKTKNISCLASNMAVLKGHRLRLDFIEVLKNYLPEVDLFGRGHHFIADKKEGLQSYRYSIAMENTAAPYYFTEKINDCFLMYTVPIYYGCKNIGAFFPERSFIQVDINDTAAAIKTIRAVIEKDDWNERMAAVTEARQLVLDKYQPRGGATPLRNNQKSHQKQTNHLDGPPEKK